MSDAAMLALAGCAGMLLGAAFFGGLWWTVRRGAFRRNAPHFGFWAASCYERASA